MTDIDAGVIYDTINAFSEQMHMCITEETRLNCIQGQGLDPRPDALVWLFALTFMALLTSD